jgi:hypothetical protein
MSSDSLTFEDLPEDQTARDCIAGVVRAGVIAPLTMKPPRFGPDYAVTRAQVAVYLSRAMGLQPLESRAPTFGDVPATHWAYGFVEAIYARGIMSGTADRPPMFMPDEAVTRETAAVFLCRAKGLGQLMLDTPTFADVPRDYWAYGWIERLVDRDSWGGVEVAAGCATGSPPKFCPTAIVTRSGLAILLCRAFKLAAV